MKAYEAFADALIAEGTEVVFGVLGGDNDAWVHYLDGKGIRYIPARHEQGAVGMADGYARATGRPGIATVTLGPGLTNAITPMTAARLSGSPLITIIGQARDGDGKSDRFGNMIIDQEALLRGSIGTVMRLSGPERMGPEVQACFRHVRLGRGPAAFVARWDLLDRRDVPPDWRYRISTDALPQRQVVMPDPTRIEAIASMISASKRPVILAGRGAILSNAHDALVELADRVGAVLTTSLQGRGWFDGEAFSVGASGGFAWSDTRAILERADLVIGFGASFNHYTLDHGRLYQNARLVHIDSDSQHVADIAPFVNESVVGDANQTARELLATISERTPRWRTAELAAEIEAIDKWRGIEFEDRPDSIDPRLVSKVCDELLPRNKIVAIDIGHFMASVAIHMTVSHPFDLVIPWRLGAMGCALPQAIGTAVARPDRLTVLFIGDGGIMTTATELDTAVRAQVPLLVVVVDDDGYGAERYGCKVTGKSPHLINFKNPDYATVARGFGMNAERISDPETLRQTLKRIGYEGIDRPTLLDVKVHQDVYTEEIFKAMTSFRGRDLVPAVAPIAVPA